MDNPFRKKSADEIRRENAELKKELAESREWAEIHEENLRLKEEKARLAKRDGSFRFDPDGFLGGVDAILGNDKPKRKRR